MKFEGFEPALALGCLVNNQLGQRMFAVRFGADGEADEFVGGHRPGKRHRQARASLLVMVPVLSNAKVRTLASRSRATPLSISTPVPANRPSAAMTAAGVAKINAHGQATTSTESVG